MKLSLDEILHLTRADGGNYKTDSIEEANNFTKKIALGHYENFPVGSLLIPQEKRQHFYNIYAFSRISDDIADEPGNISKEYRIESLEKLKNMIGEKTNANPIFSALADTMDELDLPKKPFEMLIDAFIMDVNFKQPESFDDLLYYCKHSANPVGELVLRLFDLYNEDTREYSDAVCTGLQLANFWQDLSVDLNNNRCYIPKEILTKYELLLNDLHYNNLDIKLSSCIFEIFDYTEEFFKIGKNLINRLKPYRLKLEIKATIYGGERILYKTRKLGRNIFNTRPELTKIDMINIMIKSIFPGK